MPVVSYASVSGRPRLVAVGCNPASFTTKLAIRARAFSLSLLDKSSIAAFERLATTSGAKVEDKLAAAGLPHKMGVALPVPVIDGAEATLECRMESKLKLGDHVLLVGRVQAAYASAAFSDFWDFAKYRPILYTGWRDGMSTFPGT